MRQCHSWRSRPIAACKLWALRLHSRWAILFEIDAWHTSTRWCLRAWTNCPIRWTTDYCSCVTVFLPTNLSALWQNQRQPRPSWCVAKPLMYARQQTIRGGRVNWTWYKHHIKTIGHCSASWQEKKKGHGKLRMALKGKSWKVKYRSMAVVFWVLFCKVDINSAKQQCFLFTGRLCDL